MEPCCLFVCLPVVACLLAYLWLLVVWFIVYLFAYLHGVVGCLFDCGCLVGYLLICLFAMIVCCLFAFSCLLACLPVAVWLFVSYLPGLLVDLVLMFVSSSQQRMNAHLVPMYQGYTTLGKTLSEMACSEKLMGDQLQQTAGLLDRLVPCIRPPIGHRVFLSIQFLCVLFTIICCDCYTALC